MSDVSSLLLLVYDTELGLIEARRLSQTAHRLAHHMVQAVERAEG